MIGHLLISSGIIEEKEFLKIVDNIASFLAPTFKFGYHTAEDIKQEAYILAINALGNWDRIRPLSSFLFSHIRNRLCNLKRKQYERREAPCTNCPLNAYCPKTKKCLEFESLQDCVWYRKWSIRNISKKSLMTPVDIDIVHHNGRCDNQVLEDSDTLDWIEGQLDGDLLSVFLEAKITGVIDEEYALQILEIICPPEVESEEP